MKAITAALVSVLIVASAPAAKADAYDDFYTADAKLYGVSPEISRAARIMFPSNDAARVAWIMKQKQQAERNKVVFTAGCLALTGKPVCN